MLVYLVCQDYTDQLRYAGKDQVGMKCFFILCPAAGKPKAVLEMVDGTLHRGSDLVGIVPFARSPERAGISAQVLFGIKINHPSAGRRGAGIFTVADAVLLSGVSVLFPFDLGAYKFIAGNTTL